MVQVSRVFWEICRLKANPKDLPKRQYLLLAVILTSIVIDSFSSSILIPKLTSFEVVQIIVLYNLILLSSVY